MSVARGGLLIPTLAIVLIAAEHAAPRSAAPVEACIAADQEAASDALAACERAWNDSRASRAAAGVARALLRAQRFAEVPAWVERAADERWRARIWMDAGEAYQALGNADLARDAYQHALELARGRAPALAVNAASSLKGIAQASGRYGDAVRLAVGAWRDARDAAAVDGQRFALLGLVDLLDHLGDARAAEVALIEARRITPPGAPFAVRVDIAAADLHAARGRLVMARRELETVAARPDYDDTGELVRVELRLAELALRTGDDAAAARHLARVDDATPGANPDAVGQPPLLAARLAARAGDPARALGLLDVARSQRPGPAVQSRIELVRGDVLAAQRRSAEAEAAYRASVEAVEAMRAQVAFLELRQDLIDQHREPFEALFEALATRGAWDEAALVLEQMHARGHTDAILAAAESSAHSTREAFDGYADRVVRRADALTRLVTSLTPAPRAAPSRPVSLGDVDAVAFASARGRLWRVTVRRGVVAGEPITELAALRPTIDALVADPGDRRTADALGRVLLAGALPAPDQALHVVLDRVLVRVPIPALRIEGRYLIERNPVALAPTLGSIAAAPATPEWSAPVVVGDPSSDLPAARVEATEVAGQLGVAALVGKAATIDALRDARRARVLHVASHLRVDPSGPLLRFADGELGTADLLALRLAPRVAVLASCASAAGDDGDPWRSAASALLAGGARGVVATTRSVADADARALVLDFYDAGGAVQPAAALAAAQRRAIARGVPPSAWSVFIYLGSAL